MITERVNVQSPDFPPGATLEVAINNRATSLYHDEGLAIAAAQPVIADAMGVFSQIYLTREITDSVSITVKDQTGRMLYRATVLCDAGRMKEDPVLHWDEVFGKYASIPDLTISLRHAGVRFTRENHSVCIAWENVGKPHHWLAAMFLLDEHHLPRAGKNFVT